MPAPDINGEMWGIIEEVLNAQLSLDRQILQQDAIVANASKGVWMIPDQAVPDDMTNKEYISQIKKTDGAVIVKTRDGLNPQDYMPKQMYANAANVGNQVSNLIDRYAGLVDEISGNYGAAQGQSGGSATTATGYALESQNASLNIKDTFETYFDVILQRDELILMFVEEGYTKQDFLKITGKEIDPKELKQFEFSIEQSKGTNSPGHRMALEQELLQLVRDQLIPFEVFLDVSNNPVMIQAKQKLQEFQKNQAMAMQAQAAPQGGGQSPLNQNVEATVESPQVDAGQLANKGMQRVEGL